MKKKRFSKICACLLATILAGGIFAVQGKQTLFPVTDVGAVSDGYNMTSSYKSGKYYDNLTRLTLSGDQARDVMAVAMSQLGYHEGDSDGELHGESSTGSRDFVEYNVLYGKLDNEQGNGLSYGYYWCASFVNWCLRMAGVDEAQSGSEVSCQRWYDDCKTYKLFRSKNGYIPTYGDIVFFKDSGSPFDSTHVGLVRYSDGAYVYTVEGNTSNGSEYSSNGEYVALKKHAMSSSYIVGYASPNYRKNITAHTVDYSGGFLSLGQYISESEIDIFTDSALSSAAGKKIPEFSVFSVKEIVGNTLKVELDGTEGYISREAELVQLNTSENIYTVNYYDEDGTMLYLPQYRRSGEQKYTFANKPEKAEHGFAGWKMAQSPNTVFQSGAKLPNFDSDITLTALWDNNYYIVTFKKADGTIIEQFHGYYGTEYEIPSPPAAPEGYVFSGWGADTDGVIRGNASYAAEYISESELEAAGAAGDDEPSKMSGCSSSISSISLIISAAAVGVPIAFKKRKIRR